jgi:hypothetical protein
MTYPPPSEDRYDIFISYSNDDNLPSPPRGQVGWVTHFDQLLEHFLREWRGDPRIWRDNKITGANFIDDTILNPLPHVAIMIAVVSPNYVKSDWCTRELMAFCNAADRARPGIQVRNKSRIFKVVKVPLRRASQLHPVFSNLKGFEFFQVRDADNRPMLFDPESRDEARQLFHDKVGDVAWEVIDVLELIEDYAAEQNVEVAQPAGEPQDTPESVDAAETTSDLPETTSEVAKTTPEPKSERDTVRISLAKPQASGVTLYLAETTPDLMIQRDNVRRDLLHRGYKVLQLSTELAQADAAELEAGIDHDLRASQFSIHLVGNEFGDAPGQGIASFVELQDSRAAVWANKWPAFQRLIWIPANIKPQHHSQRRFVSGLLDSNYEPNTELLRGCLEDFKTTIQDKITALQSNALKQPAVGQGSPTVGIICESLDEVSVQRLDDCLYEQDCDVIRAVVQAGATSLPSDQINSIVGCDGIIFYVDNASLFWVQSRLHELVALEQEERKEFKSVAVYVGGNKTDEKERFRTKKATVIKNFEDAPAAMLGPIPPHLLRPFIDKLFGSEMKGGQAS